ncbi:MAG: xanthine dehydrogenase, molybdenum binding subunit apoprotein, partial [Tardiphaga sp.]|nr:xanthine dehydrogenase, molybdenum binding subunit apoprotein [Tardiphaga sp.]
MTIHTKGSGTTWVGRSMRRVEDPALVTGQGRFTADLPAAHWVRFVRSNVAAGTIQSITAPEGAGIVTAADLKALKPIRPMLSKFAYVPVAQPILADGVVRFTGEPIAAVYAPAKDLAEDIADQIEVEITETPALIDGMEALAEGAPHVHDEAAGNVIVEGRITTPNFAEVWKTAHRVILVDGRSRRQNATPMEARAGHAAYDAATGRVTLTCT